MTIKSDLHRGAIYAGSTPLACTITVEQTGPLTLTVRAGSFTTTGDRTAGMAPETLTLAADQTVTIVPDATAAKVYAVDLGVMGGAVDVLARSRFLGDDDPAAPPGWRTVQRLVFDLTVPPLTTDLAGLDVHTFTVRPGFPDGTTAADWQVQTGGAR